MLVQVALKRLWSEGAQRVVLHQIVSDLLINLLHLLKMQNYRVNPISRNKVAVILEFALLNCVSTRRHFFGG